MLIGTPIVAAPDVGFLDTVLLDSHGLPRVLPAAELLQIPYVHRTVWANRYGLYQFPTVELIDWLRDRIGGRSALEICAGHGALGRAMGVRTTDAGIHLIPEVFVTLTAMRQTPIRPPEDVARLEAGAAVSKFVPDVVFGAYVTQLALPDDDPDTVQSSVFGVDELDLIPRVQSYITIGSRLSHGTKRALSLPHTRYQFPWLVTRSMHQGENEIIVWGK